MGGLSIIAWGSTIIAWESTIIAWEWTTIAWGLTKTRLRYAPDTLQNTFHFSIAPVCNEIPCFLTTTNWHRIILTGTDYSSPGLTTIICFLFEWKLVGSTIIAWESTAIV